MLEVNVLLGRTYYKDKHVCGLYIDTATDRERVVHTDATRTWRKDRGWYVVAQEVWAIYTIEHLPHQWRLVVSRIALGHRPSTWMGDRQGRPSAVNLRPFIVK